MRVAFRENDTNHENDINNKDNSGSYKQGVEWWTGGHHKNHRNDENYRNPERKSRVPQTTGVEIPENQGRSRMHQKGVRCQMMEAFLDPTEAATTDCNRH